MPANLTYITALAAVNIGDSAQNYTFCYPNIGGNPFYLAACDGQGFRSDIPLLRLLLGESAGDLESLTHLPSYDFGLPSGARLYDISNYINPFVGGHLGKFERVPGPNCYQAAMVLSGYAGMDGRYVHDEEIAYYLMLDFEEVPDGGRPFGSINIHSRNYALGRAVDRMLGFSPVKALAAGIRSMLPALPKKVPGTIPSSIGESTSHAMFQECVPDGEKSFGKMAFAGGRRVLGFDVARQGARILTGADAGEHASVNLLGGLVFQKGGFADYCAYRIVRITSAMVSIEMKRESPFDPKPEPLDDKNFRIKTYRRLLPGEGPKFERDMELSAAFAPLLPLIEYYAARLDAVKGFSWSDFENNRIDLLTMENFWRALRKMDEALSLRSDRMRALAGLPENIAEGYLKLQSLKWQYQAMVDRFAPDSERWSPGRKEEYLKELYRAHYVHADSETFRAEIRAHLKMRGVAEERAETIIDSVAAKIKGIDPVIFAPSDGARGIEFEKILEGEIGKF